MWPFKKKEKEHNYQQVEVTNCEKLDCGFWTNWYMVFDIKTGRGPHWLMWRKRINEKSGINLGMAPLPCVYCKHLIGLDMYLKKEK